MKHSVNRTTVISFSRRTNLLGLDYKLCESLLLAVIDLEMLNYSNLNFHRDVDNIFLKAVRFLCLIQIVTFSFFSVQKLLVLYCILVIPQLECASVAWNSIALTDACKLECIHQTFLSLGCRFFSHIQLCQCPHLKFHTLSVWRCHLDTFFFVFNVYIVSKFCSTLLNTVGFCVLNKNLREFILIIGDPKCCCSSAICALVANVISRYGGIFNANSVTFKSLLN
jgi:hypothetical protein